MATALIESVLHWRKKLEKDPEDEYVLNVIRKLSKVPMTLEILEATHIGKTIRKLSKREDAVGEKAKAILNKWRESFASQESDRNKKLPNDSRKENVNKEGKISSKHLSHEKTNSQKELLLQSKHLSEQSLKKYVNGSANNTTKSSPSHCKYDAKKRKANYMDYDPHTEISEGYNPESPALFSTDNPVKTKKPILVDTEISEGYNPECPALFSTDNPVKTKKPVLVETYVPSSVKRKLTHKKEQNEDKSQQKKLKSSNNLDTVVDSRKSSEKNTHNSNKDKTKDKTHSSSHKKESDKLSHSSKKQDSNAKKTKSKESSKTDKTKSKKTELKILSSEEFTAAEVSFEDVLGLNDIVSLKKHSSVKKQSSSSTPSKQKPTEKCKNKSSKTVSPNEKVKVSKDLSSHSDIRKVSKDSANHKTKDSSHPDKNIPFIVPKPDKEVFVDISSTLPKITNLYIPRSPEISEPKRKVFSDADAMNFLSSRKERTAVYSGKRAQYGATGVPSLIHLCQRLLMDYLDHIQCIGDTAFENIFPVLAKCNPMQLYNIEKHNQHRHPAFLVDTDGLWEKHCKKDFKLQKRADHESWRDLYLRAKDEEEQKFKIVTKNISRSMLKSTPVRQTKLAYVDSHYVKPPRDVFRKQVKNGTAVPVNPVKKQDPLKRPKPASALPSASASGSASKKPKPPAPLMAKTLKQIKGFRR